MACLGAVSKMWQWPHQSVKRQLEGERERERESEKEREREIERKREREREREIERETLKKATFVAVDRLTLHACWGERERVSLRDGNRDCGVSRNLE
jgi:hypothetical protein